MNDLIVIAGPCVIESRDHAMFMAERLRDAAVGTHYIFKASYDKANRSSARSFRGPGLDEGLKILEEVRREAGVPVLSDVHETAQIAAASAVLDVIQIPAFLCRQTDMLVAAAATGKMVNVKKGQFMAPWEMKNVVEKIGGASLMLTERGASFGYNNLVVDFRSFQIMKSFGCPVIFDVTHSLQLPGGAGDRSGGQPEFIPMLAVAGTAAGVDGLFMEVHDDPPRALSDGPNALDLALFPALIERVLRMREAAR